MPARTLNGFFAGFFSASMPGRRLAWLLHKPNSRKEVDQWYSGVGVEIIVGQNRANSGVQNSTKFCVRHAGGRWSHRFPRQMVRDYCAWSVSANEISSMWSPTSP